MVVDKKCVIPSYMKQQIMVVEMEGVLILPFVHVVALVYTILVFVKFATNR
jgi:predicted membrane protein